MENNTFYELFNSIIHRRSSKIYDFRPLEEVIENLACAISGSYCTIFVILSKPSTDKLVDDRIDSFVRSCRRISLFRVCEILFNP